MNAKKQHWARVAQQLTMAQTKLTLEMSRSMGFEAALLNALNAVVAHLPRKFVCPLLPHCRILPVVYSRAFSVTFVSQKRCFARTYTSHVVSSRLRCVIDKKIFVELSPKGWIVVGVCLSSEPMTTLPLVVTRY